MSPSSFPVKRLGMNELDAGIIHWYTRDLQLYIKLYLHSLIALFHKVIVRTSGGTFTFAPVELRNVFSGLIPTYKLELPPTVSGKGWRGSAVTTVPFDSFPSTLDKAPFSIPYTKGGTMEK